MADINAGEKICSISYKKYCKLFLDNINLIIITN